MTSVPSKSVVVLSLDNPGSGRDMCSLRRVTASCPCWRRCGCLSFKDRCQAITQCWSPSSASGCSTVCFGSRGCFWLASRWVAVLIQCSGWTSAKSACGCKEQRLLLSPVTGLLRGCREIAQAVPGTRARMASGATPALCSAQGPPLLPDLWSGCTSVCLSHCIYWALCTAAPFCSPPTSWPHPGSRTHHLSTVCPLDRV